MPGPREFECPGCGQLTADPVELLFLDELALRNQVIKLLRLLIKAYPNSVGTEDTVDHLYTPEKQQSLKRPADTVKVYMSGVKRELPRHGWYLVKRGVGRYALEKMQ